MITMVDEIYDRNYQEARRQLNASIVRAVGRLGRSVVKTFEVLVNIEYQSPWSSKPTRARCN
jgi:hypothetical protein